MTNVRLRRRLLVYSAPPAVAVLIVAVKLWSVVIAGRAADADFAARNSEALRRDVEVLSVLNVGEPEKTHFTAGTLAVLDGHLEMAADRFSLVLAGTEPSRSCPVRINLELVDETLGDRLASTFDGSAAVARYRDALHAVQGAPSGCFAGSADPDEGRRAVLDGAARRLEDKINAARELPPGSPPPLPAAPPPPPPTPSAGIAPAEPGEQLQLHPGTGDPLDRLQQILRDGSRRVG